MTTAGRTATVAGRTAPEARRATDRGGRRRTEIAEVAAAILREEGPAGVSHRTVARRVGCSLSLTTYYFESLDELLAEAGRINIGLWASRAEAVAEAAETEPAPTERDAITALVLRACLPEGSELLGHYLQLIAAGGAAPVSTSYRTGRDRLNGAVARVLRRVECTRPPELVIAVVDGAAVSALSEGRDVREDAGRLLGHIL
ncbi:TetR/AcrR family transcriptional regulator [Georgenia yuyongxinii]|uniref:TetR/AcrR family transcriptional regulator n=1 Tax=Georgenia yuyongxinii TaxID=2589797 RepID=A0A552WJQ1_9MICO|nr:TetR/AcrR family transcriptional regulator [Georgenia yuyongxinii]TRW42967.1 TetR/AcrR family transcriptional regulator [Georgenia yuyongxinii]